MDAAALNAEEKCNADDARMRAWLDIREPLERQLEPLGRAAIDALWLRAGDRVLDIGCGIGSTPATLAQAVGPNGTVVGIDVLSSAIAIMRSDASSPPNVSFVHGDASPHLPPQLVVEAERARHFSFADPIFLRETLTRAGYLQIDIRKHDQEVRSGNLRSMLDVFSRVGSLGALLREHPEFRGDTVPALEQALTALDGPGGPALRASTWVVRAFAPNPLDGFDVVVGDGR